MSYIDPYGVLGVSRDAAMADIKKKYRDLVKQYHPDKFVGTPMEAEAQEKLKRINIAYDEIVKEREGGGSARQSRSRTAGWEGAWQEAATGGRYADIREMINRGMIMQAEAALARILERDAEWYYLHGLVTLRRGWFSQAYEDFVTAVRMDPGNPEYRAMLERLEGINRNYTARAAQGINVDQSAICRICGSLLCINACCGMGSRGYCC